MEGRWERKASEQLKIRGEKHGGRRLRHFQNERNTSQSLLLRMYSIKVSSLLGYYRITFLKLYCR